MAKLGEHAVVLGASVSGVPAARVVADFYRTATVVERDVLAQVRGGRGGVLPFARLHELRAPILDGLDSLPERLTATRTYDLEPPEVGYCSTCSDGMLYASGGWFMAVAGRPVRVSGGPAWAEARSVAAISAQRAREALAIGLTGWPR
jgi:hypothetical protein